MTAATRWQEASRAPTSPLPACLTGSHSTQLLVELAHDLRSPLTAILTLAESLRSGVSGPLTHSQRRQLALIHASALRLCGTTSDTLELAQGDAGARPAPQRFSVAEVLKDVRATVLPMAEEKEIRLEVRCNVTTPRLGDVRALRRTLLNLTTNGVKATERGGVRVTAQPGTDGTVTFAVRDTGPGMDLATLQTLWQPFRPMADGRHSVFSSSGLGLSICRKLVTRMGGELRVSSALGTGSRFSFTIPLATAS